jgi:hypothetical protein
MNCRLLNTSDTTWRGRKVLVEYVRNTCMEKTHIWNVPYMAQEVLIAYLGRRALLYIIDRGWGDTHRHTQRTL